MHKILFYNKFIIFLYMFREIFAHHQEVKLYYTASGIVKLVSGRPVHRLREDCARDSHLQVRRYQMLYNTILTS